MNLLERQTATAYTPPLRETPLIVDKVRYCSDDEKFVIFTTKWTDALKALFPNLNIGYNPHSFKDNTTVAVKGNLGYRPQIGETVIAVDLMVDSQSKQYGVTLGAKQLYAESLSSFDKDGKVILNERYTSFDNLAHFLSTTCKVKGLGVTTLIRFLERVQAALHLTPYETIAHLTETVQKGEGAFLSLCAASNKKMTVNQSEIYRQLYQKWFDNLHVQNIYNELADFGFTHSESRRIVNKYGNMAVKTLTENPYKAIEVKGIGWSRADDLGKKIGIPETDERRVISGIEAFYREQTANTGDTLMPARETYLQLAQNKFGFKREDDQKALMRYFVREFERGEKYRLYPFADTKTGEQVNYFTNRADYDVELEIAKRLVEINKNGRKITDPEIKNCATIIHQEERIKSGQLVSLDPSQIQAIYTCLSAPVSILTGGAGCGKTTILRRLILCAQQMRLSVALCSPTGKAAKRMTESVNIQGVEAATIHRTLIAKSATKFEHDEHNPLSADWIFVDESSMTDIYLARSLLRAVKQGARVTFIGDPNQLPSVQKGCFFFDIIDSQIFATGRLTVTHRQADGNDINDVAHAILTRNPKELKLHHRKNVFYQSYDALTNPAQGGNKTQAEVNLTLAQDLVRDYKKLVDKYGIENVQVLTPARQPSNPLSSEALNPLLRAAVMHTHNHREFVKGDRVIGIKNNSIFRNGEVGTVTHIDKADNVLYVLFDGDREPKNCEKEKQYLNFAYAITVHKSQGSEYQHVLIPMSLSDVFMLNCNWFYTALTRGKQMVYLYGQRKAIILSIYKQSTRRKTLLRYLLRGHKAIKPTTRLPNLPRLD